MFNTWFDDVFVEAERQGVEGIVFRSPEGEDGVVLFVKNGELVSYQTVIVARSRQVVTALMRMAGLDPGKRDVESEGLVVRRASSYRGSWKTFFIPTIGCEEVLLRRLPDGELAADVTLPRPSFGRRAAIGPPERIRLPARLSVA